MNSLRKQMESDMALRGLAYRTREAYIGGVAKLAKFYGRSPDQITEPECQSYLLHLLQERKLAHSSCNVVASALQFFYRVTLKQREAEFCLPRPRVPQRLPQILSREEIAALFEKTTNLKHRAFLMTTYGGGLRLLEACHLKVSDIDSDRMTLRIEQGKGAKDRYTLLSPSLLKELRRYWIAHRPALWLFPSPRVADRAMNPHSARAASSTPPKTAPASPSSAVSTGCAMRLPPTCSKAVLMCTPFSACWDTAISPPRRATSTSRRSTCRAPPRRSTCWSGPIPRAASVPWARIRTARMRQGSRSNWPRSSHTTARRIKPHTTSFRCSTGR